MEIRFFAPGNLVSNLDFVESIFGNGGDPNLPENDAALDAEHWTGHTGCVILAPHLTKVTKKDPSACRTWDQATERQRRDGMCWKNEGRTLQQRRRLQAHLPRRNRRHRHHHRGQLFRLLQKGGEDADQLRGQSVRPVRRGTRRRRAGFSRATISARNSAATLHVKRLGHSFAEVSVASIGEAMDVKPEGYGVDKKFPDIIYVPEDAHFDLHTQKVSWPRRQDRTRHQIAARTKPTSARPATRSAWKNPARTAPGGSSARWPKALLCHKPCTVSGGGKSEISKPITDAILTGPVFVADLKKDFDQVAELIDRDYCGPFPRPGANGLSARCSTPERSLGSVIKLLTPDEHDYTPEYNAWLETVPQYLKELVFVVKRYYKPEWGDDWRDHFSVDIINGTPGNELKCDNRKLVTTYLRVGFDPDGSWRTFGLRKDFQSGAENPDGGRHHRVRASCRAGALENLSEHGQGAVARSSSRTANSGCSSARTTRFIAATTSRRKPISRGRTISFPITNRCTPKMARELIEDAIGFHQFTEPMQTLIRDVAANGKPDYFVSSANPRLVDGKPTKNPRYLQKRPDLRAIRAKVISRKWARACAAACRSASPCTRRSTPCCPAAATIRPNPASARSRATIRFITSNCRNCSWNSSAA